MQRLEELGAERSVSEEARPRVRAAALHAEPGGGADSLGRRLAGLVMQPHRLNILRGILAFSILLHREPLLAQLRRDGQLPRRRAVVQVLIVLSWPLLTAIGLYGYRLYKQGRYRDAHVHLLIYSLTGLITPLHFVYGSPDIPAFWYATIFTDFLAGASIVAFVVWSASRPAPRRLRPSSPAR